MVETLPAPKNFCAMPIRSCDLGRYFYPVRRLNAPKEAYRFIAAIKKIIPMLAILQRKKF